MSPILSALYHEHLIDAVSVPQLATFQAAIQFAQSEGIVPAPESAHAIRVAIDEALDAKEKGEERVILFNLSGHGLLDLSAYDAYNSGKLSDHSMTVEVNKIREQLPRVRFD